MYSRSYYPDGSVKLTPPDNYDGTAFTEPALPPSREENEVSFSDENYAETSAKPKEENVSVAVGNIPFLSGLFGNGGLLGGLNLKIPKIGTEEILIIAVAAFLFFSKDGDKESALILLLLLLIS